MEMRKQAVQLSREKNDEHSQLTGRVVLME